MCQWCLSFRPRCQMFILLFGCTASLQVLGIQVPTMWTYYWFLGQDLHCDLHGNPWEEKISADATSRKSERVHSPRTSSWSGKPLTWITITMTPAPQCSSLLTAYCGPISLAAWYWWWQHRWHYTGRYKSQMRTHLACVRIWEDTMTIVEIINNRQINLTRTARWTRTWHHPVRLSYIITTTPSKYHLSYIIYSSYRWLSTL
jgi:hypothetical protein